MNLIFKGIKSSQQEIEVVELSSPFTVMCFLFKVTMVEALINILPIFDRHHQSPNIWTRVDGVLEE